ncbi:hypothetical protein CHL76_02445 [Marinococcus halophilus]|uniref:LysM domain-containing protein n=1 Tax=Marinococcus halophilus TaxID=1371 RepID=A0A510Y1L7_MARHA|nr:cell wall hydrolase [Marinococcus halophilus]OZT81235.1 hypothetical protein CHL76_02445 [Marinococcus halophilus]GEK57174.1 hypothetical protein MHA01_00790 [Marinococcus halophilus]
MKKTFIGMVTAGLLVFSANTALAYTVQEGDTLNEIADEKNVEVEEIASMNEEITNVNLIYPNQEIDIPDEDTEATEAIKGTSTNEASTQTGSDLFARLVTAEAKGEPLEGKIGVAKVVMNRVESDAFPDTTEGVIQQTGQFDPVTSGKIGNTVSTDEAQEAVQTVVNGGGDVNGALYFYNPDLSNSSFMQSLTTVDVVGGHEFKK